MNKKLTTISILVFLVLGMTFSGAAQSLEGSNSPTGSDESQNGSATINVSVTSTTAIDVKPESLDFSNLAVGTQTTTGTNSGNSFGSFELENIGSEYIDRVWIGGTAPDSNPFGTGNASQYDAGNFLQVKPSNSSSKSSIRGNTSTYHYVNRYEYPNSWTGTTGEIPSYIQADPANAYGGASDSYVGRFRAGDEWYFYAIFTGTSGSNDVCDGSGSAEMRLGDTPHSSSQFGTVNFEDAGTDYTTYEINSTSGSYGYTTGGPPAETGVRLEFTDSNGKAFYREYDVLTLCDSGSKPVADAPQTIRTRYNVQAGDVNDLTAGGEITDRAQFLLDADSSSPDTMLLPGEGITVDTAIEVPQGVSQGSVQQGQITFYVTSDYDAQIS